MSAQSQSDPNLTQTDLESTIKEAFGVSKILWLNQGLLNDHTDGHIDTIARFIALGWSFVCKPSMLMTPTPPS
jgi:agmatine deiminase